MTGSQTDQIICPPYMLASSLLLKFTATLFSVWMNSKTQDPLDDHYNAWFALRAIESAIVANGSVRITKAQRETLSNALITVHNLEHDREIESAPPIDKCPCPKAAQIIDLIFILESRDKDIFPLPGNKEGTLEKAN